MATGDDLDKALDTLPPAGSIQGDPGHDQSLRLARAAALMRDRALGFTYEELAQRHGYADGSGARQALLRALEARVSENAAHLRAIENDRYELDQRRLRLIIGDPDAKPRDVIAAISVRTNAAARHARLNGLDAPVQVAISAGVASDLSDALVEIETLVLGEAEVIEDELLEG